MCGFRFGVSVMKEFGEPLECLTGAVNMFDSSMVTLYVGLAIFAYLLFLLRSRHPADFRIDLGTFAFFIAQLVHIMDEYAIRLRILDFMAMWKHLKIHCEISVLWFLAGAKTNAEWARDAEMLDINECEYEYEYEYEYDADEDDHKPNPP
jgi:hypothetical protein